MMLVSALAEGDERRLASLAQPLRCWRARQHVSAYLDDELDAGTRSAVEARLGRVRRARPCTPAWSA